MHTMDLMRVRDVLTDHADQHPASVAVASIRGGGLLTMSWGELAARVAAVGDRLADQGLRRGQSLAILLDDPVEVTLTLLAALYVGAVAVPVPTHATRAELRHVLDDAAPALIVAGPSMSTPLPDGGLDLGALELSSAVPADAWPRVTRPVAAATVLTDEQQGAIVLYTSGSTAAPKGVLLDERAVLNAGASNAWSQALRPDDVHGVVLPLYHSNGLFLQLFAAFVVGATTGFADFDASTYRRDMEALGATVSNLVAPAIRRLLHEPEPPSSAAQGSDGPGFPLRLMMYGLNLSPEEIDRFEGSYAPLMMVYGLTESAACGTRTPPYALRRPDRIGTAQPGWELRVVSPDGGLVPSGTVGELHLRGPSLMRRYLNLEEETAAVLRDGWLATGDLVRVDELGFVHFVDRLKDLVKVRGRSVATLEVESVLRSARGVRDCAVVGVEHEPDGETLFAFVELTADGSTNEIREHLGQQLAFYKVPRFIIEPDVGLPKTSVGKPEKGVLQQMARDHLEFETGDSGA